MGMPTQAGRYGAIVLDKALGEKGQNNLACFTMKLQLIAIWDGSQWQELDPPAEIFHDSWLERKDGGINEYAIRSLKECLGWDGADVTWLEEFDHSKTQLQVTVEEETYNGKTILRANWINPIDSDPNGGGLKKTPGVAKSINNRLGSKLRALAGGTSVAAPAKPATRPTLAKPAPAMLKAPAKKPEVAPPTALAAAPEPLTYEQAWEWYVAEAQKLGVPDDQIANMFLEAAANVYQGKDLNTITDWSEFKAKAGQIPF